MHTNVYRSLICTLINRFVPYGIGAEIGIRTAETSEYILTHTQCKHLYMIDPWERNYSKGQGLYSTKRNPDKDCEFVTKRFIKMFPKNSTIIRKRAEDAIDDVSEKLDFLFIDGNHDYDYVMKDLTLWVPKVRSGGLVIGHDWWSKFPGVIQAVTEFCHSDIFVRVSDLEIIDQFIPAPASDPVVMKSWPHGHLWWSIRR